MRLAVHALSFAAGVFVLVCAIMPSNASAAVISRPFEISGWIPYWRAATGTADILPNLDRFTEVNPFGYTVQDDGLLWDAAVMSQEPWVTLKQQSKEKKVRFIPTVMWSDPDEMHAVLSNPTKRAHHIRQIVEEVNVNGYDGIDIDYEGKYAKTRPHFSAFLKELYKAMGNKWVQCTIESRTPLSSRYLDPADIPKDLEYANDFVAINKYCDRVKFMTYDQRNVDVKLREAAEGPYAPVSDTRWVEKAILEALKTIPKKKVMLGIPTYGYEWEVTAHGEGDFTYRLDGTFNPKYGSDIAEKYNVTPIRNEGGELGLTFFPEGSMLYIPRPATSWPGNLVSQSANLLAGSANQNITFNMLTWQDSQAIADKVALAKKLGIRGVAVFKIDGGQDPKMWEVLK